MGISNKIVMGMTSNFLEDYYLLLDSDLSSLFTTISIDLYIWSRKRLYTISINVNLPYKITSSASVKVNFPLNHRLVKEIRLKSFTFPFRVCIFECNIIFINITQ